MLSNIGAYTVGVFHLISPDIVGVSHIAAVCWVVSKIRIHCVVLLTAPFGGATMIIVIIVFLLLAAALRYE